MVLYLVQVNEARLRAGQQNEDKLTLLLAYKF